MNYLTDIELKELNLYYNATLYLSVGQLYLLDNPLLKRELTLSDVKPRLVGHWGTVPGQNFILMHLNRVISKYDLNMIYVIGPGHGGQAAVTNAYLDGTYSEIYPNISKDEEGLKNLFRQFSFPKGISSHVAPDCPGSIHEGGELGYSLSHAFGAALDNPTLISAVIVGDGEAETGPLQTSWNINKFLNPVTDGVVLPILHLNGYKISNPTVFSRMTDEELTSYFKGFGWEAVIVEGKDVDELQNSMAYAMDKSIERIKEIKNTYKDEDDIKKVYYPVIIFKNLKGFTGPKEVEGSFKAHQIPLQVSNDEELAKLTAWLKSYHPEEIFDENGKVKKEVTLFMPSGNKRMSANPVANGGLLRKELHLPDVEDYLIDSNHGKEVRQDMMELGKYLRDVIKLNKTDNNFRIFGPDEALSNRLNYVFEETKRQWVLPKSEKDELESPYGRVLDAYLSEHFCEGALEGYLLTGRHGLFHSYEAFVKVVDSMVGQHAKWLKMCKEINWKADISSLNIICTSHVWQQDHNGYTHQDPGFINNVLTKKDDIVNVYLPYDANSLIVTVDHALKSKNKINTIIASKHERHQWLNPDETINHFNKGVGIFDFASDKDPDIVLACAGDTPTLEVLAASDILRKNTNIKVRVVNVIDLIKFKKLSNEEFNDLFPKDIPVMFIFHGYKNVIESLTYNRSKRFYIFGYDEEGSITTPFDMRVLNKIDRLNICLNTLKITRRDDREFKEFILSKLDEHNKTIGVTGKDIEAIEKWEPNF